MNTEKGLDHESVKKRMVEWHNESSSNASYLKSLLDNDKFEDLKDYQKFDSEKSWDVISSTIGKKKSNTKWLYQVAASVVFLLGTLWLGNQYLKKSDHVDIMAADDIREMELPDGTQLWLDSGATVSYDKSSFETDRSIEITGRVMLSVTKQVGSQFTVKSDDIKVTVLGTVFTVDLRQGLEVSVLEGRVEVEARGQEILLKKGNMARLNSNHLISEAINIGEMTIWKNTQLEMDNEPLSEALEIIGKRHFVTFECDPALIKDCNISTVFKNETLQEVLQELELLYNLKYEMHESQVSIQGLNCN